MSLNGAMRPATKEDAKAWDKTYEFGEHGKTLADPDQAGFKALFKDIPGTDGAIILKRGTIITKTPNIKAGTQATNAIKEALNQR